MKIVAFFAIVASVALLVILPAQEVNASSQIPDRPLKIAVLHFGNSPLGRLAADQLAANVKRETGFSILDPDLARAAALGVSYSGSLNLSRTEAHNLGAALGCDFYILGDAQTLRRSPSTGPVYFESYASIFLVSARTGKLISWERPNFRADNPEAAEKSLMTELSGVNASRRLGAAIGRAQKEEQADRELTSARQVPIIEAAPDDEKLAESEGLRLPRPFRRLAPAYPNSAALAEAVATVDVLVDLDAKGEVISVEVDRWAGFGLDQSTIETVRQLHFFPAMRNGAAVPMRIMLRYNFRKPPR
ncbi:MAG TPA: energy transducer TonB [Pyrinomonadaceae bacterium]|nr:energy transducer TonB [Pyrinomonadaceae bacterium]